MLRPFCDGICGHEIKKGDKMHQVVLQVNNKPELAMIFCDNCMPHTELPLRAFIKRMQALAGGQSVQGVDGDSAPPAEPSKIILPGGA